MAKYLIPLFLLLQVIVVLSRRPRFTACRICTRRITSNCYRFIGYERDYADALTTCNKLGGQLAELRSELARDFVIQQAYNRNLELWVGLKRMNRKFRWASDNKKATIPAHWWDVGEPDNLGGNEDCVVMRPNGKLDDLGCDKGRTFLCEIFKEEKTINFRREFFKSAW